MLDETRPNPDLSRSKRSIMTTHIYTTSNLIFFSFLGTLARLGLQSWTFYPGAPVVTGVVWANFAGCLVMGFLSADQKPVEGRRLEDSRRVEERARANRVLAETREGTPEEESGTETAAGAHARAAEAGTSIAGKKTSPIYIGLSAGFCGSLTSFSAFMRDACLALTKDLPAPSSVLSVRNGGHNIMAMFAVIVLTSSLCLSALQVGTHLSHFLYRFTRRLPAQNMLNLLILFLTCTSVLTILLCYILLPTHPILTLTLLLSPPGTLLRHYLISQLNRPGSSFPLGTFLVNLSGTLILGLAWDLQHFLIPSPTPPRHPPIDLPHAAAALQALQDGFCGCLTTVSTWAVELNRLNTGRAYRYAAVSVAASLACLVLVIGAVKWSASSA